MSGFVQKRPGQVVEAQIDWTEGYLEPGECIAEDLGWRVESKAFGAPVRVLAFRRSETRSTATVAEGVAGGVYMLAARIRTSAGRVMDRALTLRVV